MIEAFRRTSDDHPHCIDLNQEEEGFEASSVEEDSTAFFLKM